MHAADDLAGSPVPVAIIAAERDELIGAARTARLRARISNLVFDRTIAGATHNDIYDRAEFRQAMAEALRTMLDAPGNPTARS